MNSSPTSLPNETLASVVQALDENVGVGALVSKLLADPSGETQIAFSGVWGAMRGLLAAAMARHHGNILMLLPQAADADIVAGDGAAFGIDQTCALPLSVGRANQAAFHDTDFAERLQVLQQLRARDPEAPQSLLLTAYIGGAMQMVPTPQQMEASTRTLSVGDCVEMDEIRSWLAESGFASTTAVQLPGEFAGRGGLMDVFSPDQDLPLRIEWFGDEIESIRRFDLNSQRSVESVQRIEIAAVGLPDTEFAHEETNAPAGTGGELGPITDYLPDDTLVVVIEPHDCELSAKSLLDRTDDGSGFLDYHSLIASMNHLPMVTASTLSEGGSETIDLRSTSADGFALGAG